MITVKQVKRILSTYEKYKWNLRFILLSNASNDALCAELQNLFLGSDIITSNIDAAWFSRVSPNGREAWELRHLSISPFALVETFGPDDDDTTRENIRKQMETRLAKLSSKTK